MDSSFLVWYNKLGIVHGTYLGVSGYNLKKKCIFVSEDLFYFSKQCRPFWNAASGSSLFVKVPVKGFPVYKGFNPYPVNIFCPENVVSFKICCMYSSALFTSFYHESKHYEHLGAVWSGSILFEIKGPQEHK